MTFVNTFTWWKQVYECEVLWNRFVKGIENLLFKGFDIIYGLSDPTPTNAPSKKISFYDFMDGIKLSPMGRFIWLIFFSSVRFFPS